MTSSFTKPFRAEAVRDHIVSRWFPGMTRQKWLVGDDFEWAVGSLEKPEAIISVPKGYEFDGASVPFPANLLYPRAHPKYMQAAALHDFIYEHLGHEYSRSEADEIFHDAMLALDVHAFHAWVIWASVRIGGWPFWWKRYGHPERRINTKP